jgi:hypothetical protein
MNVNFSAGWSDEVNLSTFIFSLNQTGVFVNSSALTFNAANNISSNISMISALPGTTVQWRFFANDSSNGWNWTDLQSFVVSNKPPVWSNPQKNESTVYPNMTVNFSAAWSDEVNLSGFIFSINKSGVFVNSSFAAFNAANNVSSNISAINVSAGTTVQWMFFANDTDNGWNWTPLQSFAVSADLFPSWSNPARNQTTVSQYMMVRFNTSWSDDRGLSGFIFSINQSGTWVNSSFAAFDPATNLSGNVSNITASPGSTVQWRFFANDSSNQWNWTPLQSFSLYIDYPPNWTNPQSSPLYVFIGDTVTFTTAWADDFNLSGYIFSINESGTWVNSSFSLFNYSTNISVNISTISSPGGTVVQWRFYANDSGNGWNYTSLQSFAVLELDLYCRFVNANNCTGYQAKVLGSQNDSGGVNNAHAQNHTLNAYSWSLCCNSTNDGETLSSDCSQETVVRLSSENNAHVQANNMSTYQVQACLANSGTRVNCHTTYDACIITNATCLMSLASSDSLNYSNAHIGECGTYSLNVCCRLLNSPPSAPNLTYPVNNNYTVEERRPNFNWTNVSDPDGDLVTYTISATCGASCTCASINVPGLPQANYTHNSDLCVDVLYNWSVSACDPYSACNSSVTFNFTIPSVLDFVLIANNTDFGGMGANDNNDTLDNSPAPFVGRNNGNVMVNATINATAIFSSVALNTSYFQYLAANNESGSIASACSQTSFANMDSNLRNLFCNLSHYDANDEVRIDLNITIPAAEGPGEKASIIQIVAVSAE